MTIKTRPRTMYVADDGVIWRVIHRRNGYCVIRADNWRKSTKLSFATIKDGADSLEWAVYQNSEQQALEYIPG